MINGFESGMAFHCYAILHQLMMSAILIFNYILIPKRSITSMSYKYVSGSQLKFLLEGKNMKYLFM